MIGRLRGQIELGVVGWRNRARRKSGEGDATPEAAASDGLVKSGGAEGAYCRSLSTRWRVSETEAVHLIKLR